MERLKTLGLGLAEGAALVVVVRLLSGWWALPLAVLLWWLHERKTDAISRAQFATAIFSSLVILALNNSLVGQLIVVLAFGLWQFGRRNYNQQLNFRVWQAGWLQFWALTAIFSAEAIWHWPTVFSLVMAYVASVVVARGFIAYDDRAMRALAAAWGLIVVEASLIFSVWLVQYVLSKDILLVPQPAVVITVLGYCFGSIYVAHASSKLSRARLAEYAIIGLCLVAIVIAGTHWGGTV